MRKIRINRERLFAQLRSEEIKSLGEVRRVYVEANGSFTIIKQKPIKAGLCIIPPKDEHFFFEQNFSEEKMACSLCGYLQSNSGTCHNCKSDKVQSAMVVVKQE